MDGLAAATIQYFENLGLGPVPRHNYYSCSSRYYSSISDINISCACAVRGWPGVVLGLLLDERTQQRRKMLQYDHGHTANDAPYNPVTGR